MTRSLELIGEVQLLLASVETLADSLLESYSYLLGDSLFLSLDGTNRAPEAHKRQSADCTLETGRGPLKFPKHGVPVNIILCSAKGDELPQ